MIKQKKAVEGMDWLLIVLLLVLLFGAAMLILYPQGTQKMASILKSLSNYG